MLLTVFQQVCDVELERGEDLVEHLEVLAEARHLDDEAGGRLRGAHRQNKRTHAVIHLYVHNFTD